MFKQGLIYRHKKTKDIDFYVHSLVGETSESVTVDVKYWNRHYEIFQPDAISTETITIYKNNLKDWIQL